ncbi:EexN family lipoprotein [Methylomonas methanica]|uniref:Uncharacterized protein n=1 Tax=Methylomonas methanica (strain DSM 25384 / MC09) TaxID=857087 RepID=F9ZXW6_METMM|nr:EexN family lipoprotein [Methylomonas methanica]AEF98545.1 hypothetical protein Metme_0095 [Methylomonas methanica MC09]
MKKNSIILLVASLVLMLSAFKVISAEEVKQAEQAKSIAWYVANVKEAKAKNQQCFDNPGLKATEDCENALHALQISFKGGN